PIIATTSCLALVLLTMTVFMLYDHVIKKESDKKDLVLEHKRQFVRFVSHEIRTPLNAVKLGLLYLDEVMRDEVAADHGVDGGRCGMNEREYLKHTSDILQSTDVAVAVLDDFLQYDKIQAGQLTLESKPFVLCEVIQDNIKLFLLPAAELRIRIVFIHETPDDKCQPDPNGHVVSECRHCDRLHVVGDHVRMAQVFRNLMSNALKFSAPESTVVVKVTTSTYGLPGVEVVAEDGSRAIPAGSMTVSVTDTGPGLSAENLERLFGEGVQFNPNDLQGGNGSGLGLWISKGIVDMHRGKIWASSTGEGSGCTFFVELPVVKHLSFVATTQPETKLIDEQRGKSTDDKCLRNAPFRQHQRIAPEVSANAPLTGSEADDCARRESRRVLVVDDTESNRKIVRRLLHRRGYCTVEACNGLEAVNIMKSLLPDDVGFVCILMDFEMPV
ncbi:luxQ, partial [Symbiodinium microadriaticum]